MERAPGLALDAAAGEPGARWQRRKRTTLSPSDFAPCCHTKASLLEDLAQVPVEYRDPALPEPITVQPTSATHAILTQLKAGETVFQADKLSKTL